MNTFTVPPCPNWATSNISTCTQDDILIYAGRNSSIIILYPSDDRNKAATVDHIPTAHKERIIGIAVDHNNWLKPEKYLATVALDNIVKLWDFNTLLLKQCHNAHKESPNKCVAINFVDNNVISATSDGDIAVWDIFKNKVRVLTKFKLARVTCMVTSLHRPELTVLGNSHGFVFAINTKEKGKLLYKIRSFHNEITALSFCPSPYNIFESLRAVSQKSQHSDINTEIDKLCEKLEKCKRENENRKTQRKNPWTDTKLTEDNEPGKSDIKINIHECGESQDDTETDSKDSPDKEESTGPDFYKSCTKNNTPNSGIIDDREANIENRLNTRLLGLLDETKEKPETSDVEQRQSTPTKEKPILKAFEDGLLRKSVENHDNIGRGENFELIAKASNLENYLFLTKMKQSANVSIASSLNVEIDSMENETIDSVSEISERESESKYEEMKSEVESNRETNSEVESNVKEESRNLSSESINTEAEPNKDLLLAVAGKNDSMSIWRIGSDGRLQIKLRLPRKKKIDNRGKNQDIKIVLSWATPNMILFSYTGELLACDITKEKLNKFDSSYRLIHSDQKVKGIHSIITPPYSDNKSKDMYAWTIGYDRTILRTKLTSDRTCLNYYPTFNGYIYNIVPSPLDPSRVAVAGGDSSVKLFDLSRPHTNIFNMRSVSIRGCDKVLTVAWHPTKENCLALCCTAGQIGILDPSNPSKSVQFLRQYLHANIYSLTWGPPVTNADCKLALYACANGHCVAYNVKNRNQDPEVIKLKESENLKISEVSWKPDYTVLTFGCQDGSIIFSNRDLDILCTTYDFKKTIQGLLWHPQMTATDNEESQFSKYLAAISIKENVLVYNCEKVLQGERPEIIANLTGHTAAVNSVCWSPHTNGFLVTASNDGTVRVWNVIEKTLIALYDYGIHFKIFACMWSPLDPDIIFSGGNDNILRTWRISENPPNLSKPKPPKINVLNAKIERFDEDKKPAVAQDECETSTEAMATLISNEKQKKKEFFINPFKQLGIKQEIICTNTLKKLIQKFADSECDLDLETESSDEANDDITDFQSEIDPIKLLLSQSDVLEFLNSEEKLQKERKYFNRYEHMQVWRGKIKEIIQSAMDAKKLDFHHVSLAPAISNSFWRDTCIVFAQQLKENGLYFEALDYYLITNNIESGIKMLTEAKYFKEALALAKSRLSEDDPLITEIVNQWIKYANKNGQYEMAAQCYITQKNFNEAAKCLAKKVKNRKYLKIALKLANLANNTDLSKSIQINLDNLEDTTVPDKDEDLTPLKNIQDLILESNKATTSTENDSEEQNSTFESNTEIVDNDEN